MKRKKIILKLSGTILAQQATGAIFDVNMANVLASQLQKINHNHQCGIVIGGGNTWRGATHAHKLGLDLSVGHQIGMLATIMNGLIFTNILNNHGMPAVHLSAIDCKDIQKINKDTIQLAQEKGLLPVFSGGTGLPYFTTDTAAVIRAIEWGATEVWKGTNVAGVFTADPRIDTTAQFYPHITHQQAIAQQLAVMDITAYTLADQHNIKIRVFDIFEPDALIKAATHNHFGSLISTKEEL